MLTTSQINIIVYIIFGAIALIIPVVVSLRHFLGIDPLSLLQITSGRTILGIIFTILATVVCLLNFSMSIVEPWLYKRKHGSAGDYAGMSGLPLLGGFFVVLAGALMPPSVLLGTFLLLLYVIDGNGFPIFFIGIIQDGV